LRRASRDENGVLIAATLSAFLGWTLGTSKVPTASASQGLSIHVYSGALYGASYLTCGWHTVCDGSPNYERGLDFATPTFHPDKSGYFTGWAFSNDAQETVRATGTVGHDTPFMGCTSTSVDVRDTFAAIQIRLYYVHVQQGNFGTFSIYAKQFDPPVTHYTRAEYHIDYLSYIQHAGDC
jgi:hypothetical protein